MELLDNDPLNIDVLQRQENRYRLLVQNIHEFIYSVSYNNGALPSTYYSAKSVTVTGYTPEEYESNPNLWYSMIYNDDRHLVIEFLNEVRSGKNPSTIEHRIIHKNGSIRWVANTAAVEYDNKGRIVSLNGYVLDVTDRKNAESRQRLAIRVLEILNRSGAGKEIIGEILQMLKRHFEIEAAAIRLRVGDDFPYFAVSGFPEHFVETENSLIVTAGVKAGNPGKKDCNRLDCFCGAIISGKPVSGTANITPYGSFWTNSMKEFRESPEFASISFNVRDRCYLEGYESIALIPLRSNEQIIGLMQLNDHRKKMFTPDMIGFFEGIGASIGISYARKLAEESLCESNDRYRMLFENSLAVMLLIDPDDGRIIAANHAASVYYGYDTAVLTRMKISGINMLGEDEIFQKMNSVKLLRQSHFNFRHRLASGEIRDVEVYTTPLLLNGRVLLHSIIHDTTERMKAEIALLKRNQTIEKELELAQLIQKKFIPDRIESGDRIRMDFRYYPYESIGGDYFSVMPLPMGGVSVFLGDVVGHGIAASLFLSLLKAATDRVGRHYGLNPRLYLRMLNAELIDYLDFNFITAIYGLLQYADGSSCPNFTFSIAGHPKPVLLRRSSGKAELLKASGGILGVFPEINCSINTVPLEKGDRLFLYTDGIPETRNESGIIIGFDEMPELIERTDRRELGATLDAIIDEVRNFNGGKPIDDDVVLIGIEIR